MELNQEAYAAIEFQTESVFKQAGWHVELVTNYERIDSIVDQAMIQNVMRDTSTFLFLGFGSAMTGLTSAFMGCGKMGNVDYRA